MNGILGKMFSGIMLKNHFFICRFETKNGKKTNRGHGGTASRLRPPL